MWKVKGITVKISLFCLHYVINTFNNTISYLRKGVFLNVIEDILVNDYELYSLFGLSNENSHFFEILSLQSQWISDRWFLLWISNSCQIEEFFSNVPIVNLAHLQSFRNCLLFLLPRELFIFFLILSKHLSLLYMVNHIAFLYWVVYW